MSKKLDKQTMNSVFKRWWLGIHAGWNYEKMQGLGFCYSIMPALRKIYTNEEELKEATQNHMQFFNTNATTGALIVGATLAIEEEKGLEAKEAVTAIKTGLMGPLAGVGDTLFVVIPNTVIGSIAAYMAMQGNPIGIFLWFAFNILRVFLMRLFLKIGYEQGSKLVGSVGGVLKSVTECANILGITVVGALVPSVMNAQLKYQYTNGKVVMKLQDIADKIMPGLVPVLIVGFTYWLLGRKKMNSTRVLLALMALGILLFNLGILA